MKHKEILVNHHNYKAKRLRRLVNRLLKDGYHVRFTIATTGRMPANVEAARFDRR